MDGQCGTYGEKRSAYRDLSGNLKEIDNLEDIDVNGRNVGSWEMLTGRRPSASDAIFVVLSRDRNN